MSETEASDCVVGFIFNADQSKVLLVHKRRPAWQAGKINGVGGKIEAGETPRTTMVRETEEETSLITLPEAWQEVGCMTVTAAANVTVFTYIHSGGEGAAQMNDHEAIAWYAVNKLPKNVIPNLHWLIPLAQHKLAGEYKTFTIAYE